MKNLSFSLFLIFLIAYVQFAISQTTIIEAGTSINIENGTTLDLSNGNLVVSSNSVSDASIIGDGTINFSGGGHAEVQRYLSNAQWHFISSPISNATAGMFTDDYLQYYSESDYLYYDIESISTPLNPMQGYGLWSMAGSATTEVFSGNPNSGNISFNFTQTDFPDNNQEGWNLIGNPYPSAIDWNLVTIPAQLSGAFWVFDPGIGTDGDFLYFINGGGAANTTNQYISSGQGFFVRAVGGNGNIQFTNDIRVHNPQEFYKNTTNQQILVIKATANNIETQTAIRFNTDASANIDRLFDVNKLATNSTDVPTLYTQCENQNMAINTLPSIVAHQTIPLFYECGSGGEVELNFEGLFSIDEGIPIFLEDIESGYFQNLRLNNKYVFEYENGQIRNFNVHFKDINGLNDVSNNQILAWFNADYLIIDLLDDYQPNRTYHLNLYNVSGQKIIDQQLSRQVSRLPFNGSSGIYVIKIENTESIFSDKLFKK